MNNKDIIEKVLNETNNFQKKSTELREMLNKELSKSDNIDYGLVDELTTAIIEAEGKERLAVDVDAELCKLQSRKTNNKKTPHLPKWAVGLSVACIMLICTNCISVAAWNMNIFSVVIEFSKGGFTVDFGKQEQPTIELPTSENDPYGIIGECEKYGIYFEAPFYLPEGFVLTNVGNNDNSCATSVTFDFSNGKQSIHINYDKFHDEVAQMGIPSDHYNISETEVNGTSAIVSKEDNQFTITYEKDKTVFFMFTRDVPYEECEKIVDSIK